MNEPNGWSSLSASIGVRTELNEQIPSVVPTKTKGPQRVGAISSKKFNTRPIRHADEFAECRGTSILADTPQSRGFTA
jgi:hypothetical protein